MMRITLSSFSGWILVGLSFWAAASCGAESEGPQQRVVLYCSVDQQIAEPIIAEFQRRSGITVLARFDTESSKTVGLVQKLRAEAEDPLADVFWSSEVFYTIRLAREGILGSYHSDSTADWPRLFRDPQGRWYGFALRGRVIAYSTDRVIAAEAPRRLEDVSFPKWEGRVVMARPEFGTTGGDVASWFAHYGPSKAERILRGLKDNSVRTVEGNSTAVRMLHNGQADVALTDTDDVYAGQRNGWAIACNPLDQGGAGALAIPNTAALVAGGPNREQAKMLMEFLLSEDTEMMLANSDSHNTPIRSELARRFSQYSVGQPLDIDYDKVADALPRAIEVSRKILP